MTVPIKTGETGDGKVPMQVTKLNSESRMESIVQGEYSELVAPIECEIFANPDRQWLETSWQELERQAEKNLFLSWLWIGTWLETQIDDFLLIEARQQGKIVGLGIMIEKDDLLSASGNTYFLHRTGDQRRDQIWIEYNDFLLARHQADAVRQALLDHLFHWLPPSSALVIGASPPQRFNRLQQLGMARQCKWETTSYSLDLSQLRQSHTGLLDTLSRNSRHQLRRSINKYRQVGEFRIDSARSPAEARKILAIAKPLHLARWGDTPTGSGFNNAWFSEFHNKLIEKHIGSGAIELHHLQVGDETLAVIYNFKFKNRVYFYLCAINYQRSNKEALPSSSQFRPSRAPSQPSRNLFQPSHHPSQPSRNHYKPGLTAHYLLIEKALSEGVDTYDFLGGTARYKATFSSHQQKLEVSRFQQPGVVLSIKNFLSTAKSRLVKQK